MPKRRHSESSESEASSLSEDSTNEPPIKAQETCSWSNAEFKTLIKQIEQNIPEKDTISFENRLKYINWENIKVSNYSVKECMKAWRILQKQVRQFRVLQEVVDDIKEWVSQQKNSKSFAAARRHPKTPVKPASTYFLFSTEQTKIFKRKHPEWSQREICQEIAKQYKELSPYELQRYQAQNDREMRKYREEMSDFYEEHPEYIPETVARKREHPSLNKNYPKLPRQPFKIYVDFQWDKTDDKSMGKANFMKTCREEYTKLSDNDKVFWINWAQEQHQKYLKDLKEFIKQHPNYVPPKFSNPISKKETELKARLLGKPERPPLTAINLFCKKMAENDTNTELKNSLHKFHFYKNAWNETSNEEKLEYQKRLDRLWQQYDIRLQAYLENLPVEERLRLQQNEIRPKQPPVENPTPSSKKNKIKKQITKMMKPEQPPLTEYEYFLEGYKGTEKPSKVWKRMSLTEKEVYKEGLELKKRIYIAEFAKFLQTVKGEDLRSMWMNLNQD